MPTMSGPAHGGPSLRIFRPQPDSPPPADHRLAWTLAEFFEDWAWPQLLAPTRAHPGTRAIYREALTWWERLTANPPLADLTDQTLANFATRLQLATYRRGLAGRPRTLALATQRKILATIGTLARHAGPRTSRRPTAGLIGPLWAPLPRTYHRPRSAPTVAELQAMLGAADQLTRPMPRPGPWWRAWLACAFYTGLRAGTLLALRWEWVDPHPEGPRWQLPPEATPKTGKPFVRTLHRCELRTLADLAGPPPAWPTSGPIFPWPHAYSTLANDLARLGALAQLPAARRPSPHALRRAHAAAVAGHALTGALGLASRALQHSDTATTAGHYFDPLAAILAQLPDLWPPAPPANTETAAAT